MSITISASTRSIGSMFAPFTRCRSTVRASYVCSSCRKHLAQYSASLEYPSKPVTTKFSTTSSHHQLEVDKTPHDEGNRNSNGEDHLLEAAAMEGEGTIYAQNKHSRSANTVKRRSPEMKAALEKLRIGRPNASDALLLNLYKDELDATVSKSRQSITRSAPPTSRTENDLSKLSAGSGIRQTISSEIANVSATSDELVKKSDETQPAHIGTRRNAGSSAATKKKGAKAKAQPLRSENVRASTGKIGKRKINQVEPQQLTPAEGASAKTAIKDKKKKKQEKEPSLPENSIKIVKVKSYGGKGLGRPTSTGSTSQDRIWQGELNDQEDPIKNVARTAAMYQHVASKLSQKRSMILELIEKGNLSSADAAPAVALLRNALREDAGFKTLRQALESGKVPSSTDVSIASGGSKAAKPKSSTLSKVANETNKPKESKKAKSNSKAMLGGVGKAENSTNRDIMTINASDLRLTPLVTGSLEVPKLSYGLERVLFNPGVYQLQDPRSRVFNFDPYLQTIMPVDEFDFGALKQYITSSKDTTLLEFANREKKKYTGSTSSMTSALGHFHFLLSQWRPINAASLSKAFPATFDSFTLLQRGPSAIFLRYKDGTYAIDADKEFDTANILSSLGKSMEKLLTLPKHDFERYRKLNSSQITEEERNEDEAFHYTTMGDFLMRSQLDAYDPRLPGTGMFDLKTRAVVAIRMDTSMYEEGSGYEIKGLHGEWESYEREYYDMIRSAFLKYSLQVRMGRMDGIFVAFHNTERIFGFQYVSLPEMDYALHGTHNESLGDSEFKLSLDLLNRVLDRATAKYPKKSLRLFFETRETKSPFMYIFAEPVEEDEINQIQNTNKAEIEEFESRVLGLAHAEEQQRQEGWDNLHSLVEQEMGKDETGSKGEEYSSENAQTDLDGWNDQMSRHVHDFLTSSAQDNGSQEENEEEQGEEDDSNEEDQSEQEDITEMEESAESALNLMQETSARDSSHGILGDEQQPNVEVDLDVDELASQHTSAPGLFEETEVPETDDGQGQSDLNTDPSQMAVHEPSSNVSEDAQELLENEQDADPAERISSSEHVSDFTGSDGSTVSSKATDFESKEVGSQEKASSEVDSQSEVEPPESDVDESDVFAMILAIRNKVNNEYVQRPENLRKNDEWSVEYTLTEVEDPLRARKLYRESKRRRSQTLQKKKSENKWSEQYVAKLMQMAKRGREWRQQLEEKEKDSPQKILVVETLKQDPEPSKESKE